MMPGGSAVLTFSFIAPSSSCFRLQQTSRKSKDKLSIGETIDKVRQMRDKQTEKKVISKCSTQ